ncbi:MAG: hypothetical protein ABI305_05575, partial [Tepidiformaceae bacterium]
LGYEDAEVAATWLEQFLRGELGAEVYRYAVTATIATRRMPLIQALLCAANDEARAYRVAILLETLPLAERQIDVTELLTALRGRQ